ncbi:MAG: hypothetical protein QOE36_1767, partial [Gaiellaceae bacterium]|nr:hypothetical protein [Gaiellaceae bacterium]
TGTNYLAAAARVVWRSADGGRSWRVEISAPEPRDPDDPSA